MIGFERDFDPSIKNVREEVWDIDQNSPSEPLSDEGSVLGQLPFEKKNLGFSLETHFHRGSRHSGRGRWLAVWSFAAAFIDALVLISLACFFFMAVYAITEISLKEMTERVQENVLFSGVCLFLLIYFFMSVQRIFMGHSLGEWACGLRLGDAKQRLSRFYALKVLLRMFLVLATGGVVFPLISILVGRDVLGLLIRLPLIKLS